MSTYPFTPEERARIVRELQGNKEKVAVKQQSDPTPKQNENTEIRTVGDAILGAINAYQKGKQKEQQVANEKNWLSTVGDVLTNVAYGAASSIEGVDDYLQGIAQVLFGIDNEGYIARNRTADAFGRDAEGQGIYDFQWGNKLSEQSKLEQDSIVNQIAQGVGGMLPSIAMSFIPVVGTGLSKATFFGGAAGQSFQESLQNGNDFKKALGYGTVAGAIELGTESLGGWAFGEAGKVAGIPFLTKLANSGKLGKVAYTITSEGLEEVLSDLADPFNKALWGVDNSREEFFGKDGLKNWGEVAKGLPKTFVVGGLTGLFMDGVDSSTKTIINIENKKSVTEGKALTKVSDGLESIKDLMVLSESTKASTTKTQDFVNKTDTFVSNRIKSITQEMSVELKSLSAETRAELMQEAPVLEMFFDKDGNVLQSSQNALQSTIDTGKANNTSSIEINVEEENKKLQQIKEKNKNVFKDEDTIQVDTESYDEDTRKSFAKVTNAVSSFSKKIGSDIKVVIVETSNESVKGFRDGNTLYINKTTLKDGTWARKASHEITHFAQGTKAFEVFYDFIAQDNDARNNAINSVVNNYGFTKEEIIDSIKNIREKGYESVSSREQEAFDELSAHIVEDIFSNEQKLKVFVRDNSTLAKRLYNRIKDFFDTIKGTNADKETLAFCRKAVRLYEKAIEAERAIIEEKTLEYKKFQELKESYDASEDKKKWLEEKGFTQDIFSKEYQDSLNLGQDRTSFSIESLGRACGFDVVVDKKRTKETDVWFKDGKPVHNVTVEMLKDSPMEKFLNRMNALRISNGIKTDSNYVKDRMQFVADYTNLVASHKDAQMVYELTGSMFFTAFKKNSDAQYNYSVDFSSICKKTESIMNAMSERMLENVEKYKKGEFKGDIGLSKDQILDLYWEEVDNKKLVPCPYCYVFARWLGINSRLNMLYKFQEQYKGKSIESIKSDMSKLDDFVTKYANKIGEKNIAKVRNQLSKMATTTCDLVDIIINDTMYDQTKAESDKAIKKIIDGSPFETLEEARTAKEALDKWEWLKKVRTKENYKEVPLEVIFNLADSTTFADKYPEAWKWRKQGGSAGGKAVTPYTDAKLGDSISGVTSPEKLYKSNPYEEGRTLTPSERKKEENAFKKQKNQNLLGGTRVQSWSDFKESFMTDWFIEVLNMEAIHSKVQGYSKVVEGLDFWGAIGASINMSLSGEGKGYEGNQLIFSNMTGMNFDASVEMMKKYSTLGTILIGTSVDHINLSLDSKEIRMVIPYHASGNSSDTLAEMMNAVDEKYAKLSAEELHSDFSNIQTDKELTEEDLERGSYSARIKNDTFEYNLDNYKKYASENGGFSIFEENRDTREAILTGKKLTDRQMELVNKSKYLKTIYEIINNEDSEYYGCKLSKTQISNLYPFEWFDPNTTYETSYINRDNYVEYCTELGLVPKFFMFTGNDYYYKVLVDRNMYDYTTGKYVEQPYITADNLASTIATENSPLINIKDGKYKPLSSRYAKQTQEYFAGQYMRSKVQEGYELMPRRNRFSIEDAEMRQEMENLSYYEDYTLDDLQPTDKVKLQYQYENLERSIYNDVDKIKSWLGKGVVASEQVSVNVKKDKTFAQVLGQIEKVYIGKKLNANKVRTNIPALEQFLNSDNKIYTDFVYSMSPDFAQDYLAVVAESFDILSSDKFSNGHKKGNQLSIKELAALSTILKFVKKMYSSYDTYYKDGKKRIISEDAKRYNFKEKQVAEVKGDVRRNFVKQMVEDYNMFVTSPEVVASILDGHDKEGFLTEYINRFRKDGYTKQRNAINMISKAEDFLKKNKGYEKRLTTETIDFDGQKVLVGEAIDIILMSRQGNGALTLGEGGGVEIHDKRGNKVGILKNIMNSQEVDGKIQYTTCKLEEKLNDTDRSFIKVVQDTYNSGTELKVQADMDTVGFTNVLNGDYYSLQRNQKAIRSNIGDARDQFRNAQSFNNLSINQARKENAKNIPLLAQGVYGKMLNYIDKITMYNAYALDLQNFNKLWNFNIADEKQGQFETLRIAYGDVWSKSESYIRDLLNDIQGVRTGKRSAFDNILGKLRSNYAQAALGMNIKVIASQTASYPTALALLSPKSLSRGIVMGKGKQVRAEMDKYCDASLIRSYEQTVVKAESASDKITKIGEFTTKGIQATDRLTITTLWNACQVEVESKFGEGYEIGTEKNKVEAGKLLEEVITKTQPTYVAVDKSALQRSTNELLRSIAMFTSVAQKQLSLLVQSFDKYNYAKKTNNASMKKEAKIELTRRVGAVVAANAMYAMIVQAVKFLLDQDDKEDNNDRNIVEQMTHQFLDTSVGMMPFIKEIYSYFTTGYDVETMSVSAFNDFLKSIKGIMNFDDIKSGDIVSIRRGLRNLVFSAGQLVGIPTRNTTKLAEGLIKRISPESSYKWMSNFYNVSNSDISTAYKKGNEDLATSITSTLFAKYGYDVSNNTSELVSRLYSKGFNGAMASDIPDSVSIDGEVVKLTAKQKKSYEMIRSKANIDAKALEGLSEASQAKALNTIYTYYNELAKSEVLGAEASKLVMFGEAIDINVLAKANAYVNEKCTGANRKILIQNYINKLPLKSWQKYMLMGYFGYQNKNGESSVKAQINRLNLTKEEKKQLLEMSGY